MRAIAPSIKPFLSPSSFFDSSSPVSPFEYEVALGWLPQKKPLGEQGLAKLVTQKSWLRNMQSFPVPADVTTFLTPVKRVSSGLFTHYKCIPSSCGKSQGIIYQLDYLSLMLTLIVWTGFYKIPWQTLQLEMKGSPMFAPVWWWEQTLTENIKDWQSLPIFLSLPFNKSPFRHPL